ncbi:MAG: peptidase M14 [Thermoleophilaceae bacterium]|nr:peptidase M14 [Thermoleophilaceae bacterium]
MAALAALAFAAPASAAPLLDTTVSTLGTHSGSCFDRDVSSGTGVTTRSATVDEAGTVTAQLTGDEGDDWDLAVLESDSGRVVAGSAGFASDEVAEGFVLGDTTITVRACRLAGDGDARLRVSATPVPETTEGIWAPKLVNVDTPTREDKTRLVSLGLDMAEHGGEDFLAVVLYGREDVQALKDAGFSYTVDVPNLTRVGLRNLQADAAFSRTTAASGTPTGRTTYRRLFDYNEEMKELVKDNPDIVKPITLPFETYEGRRVHGIEITEDVNVRDGKPVFLQMGVHHAREWPSGEHAMEWAHELVEGYNAGDQRVENLLETTRTIVVPIVNPDGFNVSREAGQVLGAEGGRDAEVGDILLRYSDLAQIAAFPYEFWRKNCRFITDAKGGRCFGQQPSSGLAHAGVDPNRNYGGQWGGPGAETARTAQAYRGPGPFSEPETENIRSLVSSRQVTMLLTNHTFSNLWLRPPGQRASPETPDAALYEELGARMTAENGYSNVKGFELYDTTGTTEDWSYQTAGGFGFTPEIGCLDKNEASGGCNTGNFHGPYREAVVREYRGTSVEAEEEAPGPESGGNREAYFIAQEAAADPETHSIVTGEAPNDAVLRIQKTFQTDTWCSDPRLAQGRPECEGEDQEPFRDHLESSMEVPDSGEFTWHINPSTRPIVAQDSGREPEGPPSEGDEFSGSPETTTPCADFDTEDPSCWNDHPFTVPDDSATDNAKATVRIEWSSPLSDWDMKIFVDSDGDGSSEGETKTELVATSGQGTTDFEQATFVEPDLQEGQSYVVRVINYAAFEPYEGTLSYGGPDEFEPGEVESWRLTCERGGEVITSQQLTIARDEQKELDLSGCARRPGPGPGEGGGPCPRDKVTIEGTRGPDTIRGTSGRDVILSHAGRDEVFGRGGADVICDGRGADEISGGRGADRIHGRRHADFLKGQQGADRLRGGPGPDTIRGGPGEDSITGGPGADDSKQ